MEISLEQLSKRYNKEWIFRDITYDFKPGGNYALVGPNGSGKSTLLQLIAGYHLPSSGQVGYTRGGKKIPPEDVYPYLTFVSPYMELIEEFTLLEHLKFHFKFRRRKPDYNLDDIMESCYLKDARNKYIKNFSSGMKQRLKLALAFYTLSDITLLDEPTSNLDAQGIDWYQERLEELISTESLVIIASNQKYEYENYCSGILDLQDYKEM